MTVSVFVSRDANLLNCPCCGEIGTFVQEDETVDYGCIICISSDCFISTPYGTYAKCKAVWNNRTSFAQQLMEWF